MRHTITRAIGPLIRSVTAPAADTPDADLLARFIDHRDEGAFTALVQRHGPMVLGVCRRVLPNRADAEDAFQATFLLLALKAASVSQRQLVPAWLHGVARRVALKARRANARRAKREQQMVPVPEPEALRTEDRTDLLPLLDRELNHLPDRYRAVLILCDLEGATRPEAARRLKLPEGTVNSRLARGRALLAQRLTRHGVTPAAGVLMLAQCAGAAVPAAVFSSTVRVALLTVGGAVPAHTVSPGVAALTHAMGSSMLATKFKLVTGAALLLGALGATCALALGRANGPPAEPRGAVHEKEQEKPAPPAPGTTSAPVGAPTKAGARPDIIRGAVEVIVGDLIILAGGEQARLTEKTEYLRETGLDAAPAKRSDVAPGTRVYIETKKRADERVPLAVGVVIELLQPEQKVIGGHKDEPAPEPKPAGDPEAVMKAMDGFRKEVPPPQSPQERMSAGARDINGKVYPDTHLIGVANRLGVKTRAECMVLLSYLKDPDPKIRRIAAFGLNSALHAIRGGMAHGDMQDVESDGHRKMVKAFIAAIEKLPK
jgi:RNA polymerase sigma factor (sigma-70 family)